MDTLNITALAPPGEPVLQVNGQQLTQIDRALSFEDAYAESAKVLVPGSDLSSAPEPSVGGNLPDGNKLTGPPSILVDAVIVAINAALSLAAIKSVTDEIARSVAGQTEIVSEAQQDEPEFSLSVEPGASDAAQEPSVMASETGATASTNNVCPIVANMDLYPLDTETRTPSILAQTEKSQYPFSSPAQAAQDNLQVENHRAKKSVDDIDRFGNQKSIIIEARVHDVASQAVDAVERIHAQQATLFGPNSQTRFEPDAATEAAQATMQKPDTVKEAAARNAVVFFSANKPVEQESLPLLRNTILSKSAEGSQSFQHETKLSEDFILNAAKSSSAAANRANATLRGPNSISPITEANEFALKNELEPTRKTIDTQTAEYLTARSNQNSSDETLFQNEVHETSIINISEIEKVGTFETVQNNSEIARNDTALFLAQENSVPAKNQNNPSDIRPTAHTSTSTERMGTNSSNQTPITAITKIALTNVELDASKNSPKISFDYNQSTDNSTAAFHGSKAQEQKKYIKTFINPISTGAEGDVGGQTKHQTIAINKNELDISAADPEANAKEANMIGVVSTIVSKGEPSGQESRQPPASPLRSSHLTPETPRDSKTLQISEDLRFRALERQVVTAAREGANQIRMQLYPPGMGQILIRLALDGSKLRLQIKTSSSEATHSLNEIKNALSSALGDSGFTITSFDVTDEKSDTHEEPDRKKNQSPSGAQQRENPDFSLELQA